MTEEKVLFSRKDLELHEIVKSKSVKLRTSMSKVVIEWVKQDLMNGDKEFSYKV